MARGCRGLRSGFVTVTVNASVSPGCVVAGAVSVSVSGDGDGVTSIGGCLVGTPNRLTATLQIESTSASTRIEPPAGRPSSTVFQICGLLPFSAVSHAHDSSRLTAAVSPGAMTPGRPGSAV